MPCRLGWYVHHVREWPIKCIDLPDGKNWWCTRIVKSLFGISSCFSVPHIRLGCKKTITRSLYRTFITKQCGDYEQPRRPIITSPMSETTNTITFQQMGTYSLRDRFINLIRNSLCSAYRNSAWLLKPTTTMNRCNICMFTSNNYKTILHGFINFILLIFINIIPIFIQVKTNFQVLLPHLHS